MNDPKSAVDPKAMLHQTQRLEEQVRRKGRWSGWLWIVTGVVTALFCVFAPPIATGLGKYIVTIGFPIVGILALVYAWKQQVLSIVNQRVQQVITYVFMGLVVVDSIFRMTTNPNHLTPWVIVAGILPALPCFYWARRVRRV